MQNWLRWTMAVLAGFAAAVLADYGVRIFLDPQAHIFAAPAGIFAGALVINWLHPKKPSEDNEAAPRG